MCATLDSKDVARLRFRNRDVGMKRVNELLKLMHLENCADVMTGDPESAVKGGLSGGQRKRLSIAVEILRTPSKCVCATIIMYDV